MTRIQRHTIVWGCLALAWVIGNVIAAVTL